MALLSKYYGQFSVPMKFLPHVHSLRLYIRISCFDSYTKYSIHVGQYCGDNRGSIAKELGRLEENILG